MPLLNNIVSSIKTGWANLNNDDNLTMLTFLSVTYIYLIFLNSSLISDALLIGHITIFGVLIQASTLFIFILSLAASISILAGSYFNQKYHRHLQILSSITGLAFGFMLYLPMTGELGICIYSLAAGAISGFAISNILAGFISKTDFHNRGSTSGIFVFIVYAVLFIFTIMVTSLRELALVLVILKIFSLFLSLRHKDFNYYSETVEYTKTTIQTKFMFLLVWGIFLLSDVSAQTYLHYLETLGYISIEGFFAFSNLQMISQLIGLGTIFLGGILMDVYGRKKPMMFSFAYLGAIYALISFSRGVLYYFTVLDGIAFGILTVLFLIVLWGDICKPSNRTIWIALSLVFSISSTPANIIAPYLMNSNGLITTGDLFPITSFFLFIAVVIILSLPETLPDKIIQKKELEDYIKMAKKVKEKYKNGKNV
jgi:hypothetical protein